MKKSFGRGNGGGFRQPRFDDQYQRRDSGGRGSHMAAPAWQSRDSYMRDLQRDRDGGFGSFHPSQNQREPSKTAPVTAEEMNSPARETSKEKRWNMYENGHNRPTSRHEIETWISQHCEVGFSSNRAKVDTMVEFFLSSKSAESTFRYLEKVRGPKYFGTFSNYFIAFDSEMMDAGLHDFTKFLQDTLFPKNGERPLRDLDTTIPDIIRSEAIENALTRQFRSNYEFCGGSEFYQKKIEELREQRRRNPQPHGSTESASTSSSSAATTASNSVDLVDDSPELTRAQMKRLMKKLLETEEAEAEGKGKDSVASNTRSSEKSKSDSKKRRKKGE